MLDSTNAGVDIVIPVQMLKHSDGVSLGVSCPPGSPLSMSCAAGGSSCIICMEGYEQGCEVLRLPLCGHAFHDKCAKTWLKK
eukprot:CAMPEP_0197546448 /NCGR_PEP_ID=MMETSP1320-20131121/1036_1 /TAXON_ID=91990 /ORGANISM="Bolidomonas sp., Strain RCC2347" /LENGTH=81 /DNA_ID=CAMNT_0043106005 /DNA_START=508 /DNA_END=750 /DNA_ORIENTATION=-